MAYTLTGAGTLEIRSKDDGEVVLEFHFQYPAEHSLVLFQRCLLFKGVERMEEVIAVRWRSPERFEIELHLGEPIRNPKSFLKSFLHKMQLVYQITGEIYCSVEQVFELLKELESERVLPFEIEW